MLPQLPMLPHQGSNSLFSPAQQMSSLECFLSRISIHMLQYCASLYKPTRRTSLRSCQHNTRISRCRKCNGSAFCTLHGRRKETCKDCGGSSMCKHGIERRMCKRCKLEGKGGSSLCNKHFMKKSTCKECKLQ